jgi:hypothetical protein
MTATTQLQPLVIDPTTGLTRRLAAGELLTATLTVSPVISLINGESSATVVCGTPVYSSAAGSFKRARANALATAKVIGLVKDTSLATGASGLVQTDSIMTLTTGQWDAVTGETGGLIFNGTYFLDSAADGKLTRTPVTGADINTYIGSAMSTTDMDISIQLPIA